MDDDDLNPKNRGLGRGLNALFEDEEGTYPQIDPEGQTPGAQRRNLGVEQLEPGESQPRQHFDEKALQELADSIESHGLLQPILVRPHPHTPDMYEIIAGERRWRAAQKAKLHEVPVIIRDLDDSAAVQIALIENLQREDLNAIEEAMGYQKLLDHFGYNQDNLGELIGKSRSHVANMVRLLSLPKAVQDMVSENRLSAGAARAVITAKDPEALAKQAVLEGLSVRQIEKLAAEDAGRDIQSKPRRSSPAKQQKDADTLALEQEVSQALGMHVSIDTKNGHAGTLSVKFETLDQLDDVLHRLSHFPGSRQTG